MRLPNVRAATAAALVAVLTAGAAAPALAASLEIKDAVAQVTVIPEKRSDIKIEILTTHPRLPLKVKAGSQRTVIDGGLKFGRIRGCRGSGAFEAVEVTGVGDIAVRDIPQVVVHAPLDVEISAGGAVYGAIGRAA